MENREKNTFAFREYVVVLLFTVLTGIAIWEAVRIYRTVPKMNGPGTLPLILCAIMCFSILIVLFSIHRNLPKDREKYTSKVRLLVDSLREGFPLDVTMYVVITIAYLLLLDVLDYIPATILFQFACMTWLSRKRLSRKSLVKHLGIAAGVALACWIIFGKIFLVTLP